MRTPTTRRELADLFDAEASPQARAWLADATAHVAGHPARLDVLFASAARNSGREKLSDHWHTDEAARVLLLTAKTTWGPEPAINLYQQGTADERLAVLLALDVAETADSSLLALTRDALRSNDTRLITAALGSFAARGLETSEFRQAVLKCVFCAVPFSEISGLTDPDDATSSDPGDAAPSDPGDAARSVPGEAAPSRPNRADAELARMLAAFARERVAAGRTVPDDIWPILLRFPDAVADSGLLAEPSAADPIRGAAARQALDSYHRREKR
jgi:hypothetical protein